jgi:nucleoside-diphosphate-sugar epimerase
LLEKGENLMSELHVVFGTGPLGSYTARELVKLGKTVRMVNRSGKADQLPDGVEVIASDAYDVAKNVEVTKGAAAIYQCAQPHYYEWAEKFPPLQQAVLEAAARNGAKLIVGDNLYLYGDPHGQPIREDSPIQPNTKKGKVRAAMAQVVLDAHKAGKIRAAIGRASDFFGPGYDIFADLVVRPALAGKAVNVLGRTDQPHTFTYVADFGRLLATLGTRDEALGQVWLTPSPAAVTQAELVKMLEAELGRPVKVMAAGAMMARLIGLFNKVMAETVEMIYEWTGPFVMDSSKAEKAFGWKGTPLKQALKETVEWCKTNPKNAK